MTDKEVIQALRCCEKEVCADGGLCPLFSDADCIVHLGEAAIDLIERLTAENADLRKEIEWKDMVIALAQREQAKAEAERDALLPYAKEYGCETCKNEKACFVQTREGVTVSCVKCPVPYTCPCSQCKDCGNWEWRDLPAAPEEGEKA